MFKTNINIDYRGVKISNAATKVGSLFGSKGKAIGEAIDKVTEKVTIKIVN